MSVDGEAREAKPGPLKAGVDIYAYLDYRDYLRDVFNANKSRRKYFNYSHFAKAAAVGSHSYLRMVIHGERNLSAKTIHKFATALELAKKETAFFEALVLFTQAATGAERDHYFGRLVHLRPRRSSPQGEKDVIEYFSDRRYAVLREMVILKDFREDNDWVAKRLSPHMKPLEVRRAYEVLQRLGLVSRDGAGKFVRSGSAPEMTPGIGAMVAYEYERQALEAAKNGVLNRPKELVGHVTMSAPIPKSLLPDLKEVLRRYRGEIEAVISRSQGACDEVYQFGLQVFPLTHVCEAGRDGEVPAK